MYNKDDSPAITVSLYFADETNVSAGRNSKTGFSSLGNLIAGKACESSFLSVSGNKINEEGEAKVTVSVRKLSKDLRNRSFCLRFRMEGAEFNGVPHVLSHPFKTYKYKIKVVNTIESKFYKDEGGLQRSMPLQMELHSVSGIATKNEVPLVLTLHYDNDKKVQLKEDAQKLLRIMDSKAKLQIKKGKAMVDFRINDVSKNHQNCRFCIKVAPENVPKYKDVAFAFTSGVKVLSKRNKAQRKPGELLNELGTALPANARGDAGESGAGISKEDKKKYRVNMATHLKKKIQNGEKIPLANLVMTVAQYAANTTKWMDEVTSRHKQFQNDWNKLIAPCLTQLVEHAKAIEAEDASANGDGRAAAPNRGRKKSNRGSNSAATNGAGSSSSALAPTSSLHPLGPGENTARGTSFEISKLFASGDVHETNMERLHSLSYMGRLNSLQVLPGGPRTSSLQPTDYFGEDLGLDTGFGETGLTVGGYEPTVISRDRTAWIANDFYQSPTGIQVGHPAYTNDKKLLGFYKSVGGNWIFTKQENLIHNQAITADVVQELSSRAQAGSSELRAVDSTTTPSDILDRLAKD